MSLSWNDQHRTECPLAPIRNVDNVSCSRCHNLLYLLYTSVVSIIIGIVSAVWQVEHTYVRTVASGGKIMAWRPRILYRRTGQFFLRGLSHLCPKNFSTAPENCYANLQNYFARLTPPNIVSILILLVLVLYC